MSTAEVRKARVNQTNRIKAAKAVKNIPTAILLKKKAECDVKALRIVERLMEPAVDVKWMLENLRQINRSHMEDVADERAIGKLCGYVLCDNELTKVVNKKYHISTLRNKVYDVEKVKNFCSFTCYSAMEHLMMQMLTSPLWLRNEEEFPRFTLMKNRRRTKSPPGIEVNITGIELPIDDCITKTDDQSDNLPYHHHKDEKDDKREEIKCTRRREPNKIKLISPKIYKSEGEEAKKEVRNDHEVVEEEERKEKIPIVNNGALTVHNQNEIDKNRCNLEYEEEYIDTLSSSKIDVLKVTSNEIDSNTSKNITESVDDIKVSQYTQQVPMDTIPNIEGSQEKPAILTESVSIRIERNFGEWITKNTINYLNGKKLETNQIMKKIKLQEKYTALCRRLNNLELKEEHEERVEKIENLRPAPHFAVLKKQAKDLEIKARAFYGGQVEIEKPVQTVNEADDEESSTFIPLTDAHAPNALRRRIFLNKLNRVLPDLVCTLAGPGMAEYTYTPDRIAIVKTLVSTFNLSAKNIVFRTAEWKLVALLIIKMLGIVDSMIQSLLLTKEAAKYASMIVMSHHLDSDYLNNLIDKVIPLKTNNDDA